MTVSGNFVDVRLPDVLQFIHLGRRTGTLTAQNGTRAGRITLHRGRIVHAMHSAMAPLADELRALGHVTAEDVDRARRELETHPETSLARVLVTQGSVREEWLREHLGARYLQAVLDMVGWEHGTFDFVVEGLEPLGEEAFFSGDYGLGVELNTEALLLEAARVLDEARAGEGEGAVSAEDLRTLDPLAAVLRETPSAEPDLPQLQFVTADGTLFATLASDFAPHVAPRRVTFEEAGTALPGEPPPVVGLDLRESAEPAAMIAKLHARRPRAILVAVRGEGADPAELYAAGALLVLDGDPVATSAGLRRLLDELAQKDYRRELEHEVRGALRRLRRVAADLRSGMMSATIALNLMSFASETVERAVLFLVRRDDLAALGAFGFGRGEAPLAALTRGLRFPLSAAGDLAVALAGSQALSLRASRAELPAEFAAVLGHAAYDQAVVVPVLGAERPIAVLYCDNGPLGTPIEDVELLELATAQVGLAFENELLRRRR